MDEKPMFVRSYSIIFGDESHGNEFVFCLPLGPPQKPLDPTFLQNCFVIFDGEKVFILLTQNAAFESTMRTKILNE